MEETISGAALNVSRQAPGDTDALYRKVMWRYIPVLFVGYVFAGMDRFNIGFAQEGMQAQLGLSPAAYGLASGIFFVGYMLAGMPSNLMLERFGARKILAFLMFSWGLVATLTAFVTTSTHLVVLRTLLGVFEAGYFPGVVLFLSFWYSPARIAKITAIFTSGFALSSIIGNPLSGIILKYFHDVGGLAGWQWVFILEGAPACFCAFAVWRILDDKPTTARWLDAAQRQFLEASSVRRQNSQDVRADKPKIRVTADMLLLSAIYFLYNCGAFCVYFWAPALLRSTGMQDSVVVGVSIAAFSTAGIVSMVVWASRSDRKRERRNHYIAASLLAAVAICLLPVVKTPELTVAILIVAGLGIYPALTIFWSVPSALLPSHLMAFGIAFVGFIGISAGFFSPLAIGKVLAATGSLKYGFWGSGILMALSAVLAIPVMRNSRIFRH